MVNSSEYFQSTKTLCDTQKNNTSHVSNIWRGTKKNFCGGQFYYYYYVLLIFLVGPTLEPVIERDKNNVRNVICLRVSYLYVKQTEMNSNAFLFYVNFVCPKNIWNKYKKKRRMLDKKYGLNVRFISIFGYNSVLVDRLLTDLNVNLFIFNITM